MISTPCIIQLSGRKGWYNVNKWSLKSIDWVRWVGKIFFFFDSVKAFNLYADPQKQYADAVIQVLLTQLIPDEQEGKILRVRMVMKEGDKYFEPVHPFDDGSTISWVPCGRKLTCSYPGIKLFYGPETYYSSEVITQNHTTHWVYPVD